MLILNEVADATADIYTDHLGDLQGELDDIIEQENLLEQACRRTSYTQAAIWKSDNVPKENGADVIAQVEHKGLEKRVAKLDANATKVYVPGFYTWASPSTTRQQRSLQMHQVLCHRWVLQQPQVGQGVRHEQQHGGVNENTSEERISPPPRRQYQRRWPHSQQQRCSQPHPHSRGSSGSSCSEHRRRVQRHIDASGPRHP